MPTQYVDVDGTAIAVHSSSGAGPPAVLLHGNSLSAATYAKQLDGPLGCALALWAIDFPGHGESGRAPVAQYSLPGLARVIVAVATCLDLQHAVFVGSSLGGHALLEATPHLPEAAGFCVFGTPPLAVPLELAGAYLPHPVLADLGKADLTDGDILARVASMMRPDAEPPAEFCAAVRKSDPAFRPALIASLGTVGFLDEVVVVARLAQPLLVLHGAADQVVNLEYLQALVAPTLWRGEVQVLANAGHSPPWETPAAFDALISSFVTETAR